MTAPARNDTLENHLAIELFERVAGSAAIGAIGVFIMLYAHWKAIPLHLGMAWAGAMLAVFALRMIAARRGMAAMNDGHDSIPYVNTQALLGALTGLGWAGAVYVFDTRTIDPNFELRLIVIAAALTFPVSSLAVFKRVFFAYFLSTALPVLFFLATASYLQGWEALVPSGCFYVAMIAVVSFNTNRNIRIAAANKVKVLRLSAELQHALDAETSLRAELGIRADTDDLTGIFNRRGLLTQLNIELARCQRAPSSAALLLMDIDHFKQVNDTWGHAAGDAAIVAMVDIVKQQLRATDIFGRLGGEEFLVILPDMESEGALNAAERIRASVEQTPVVSAGAGLRMTVSIGVSVYAPEDDADRILARADGALYAAKHAGRNCVQFGNRPA